MAWEALNVVGNFPQKTHRAPRLPIPARVLLIQVQDYQGGRSLSKNVAIIRKFTIISLIFGQTVNHFKEKHQRSINLWFPTAINWRTDRGEGWPNCPAIAKINEKKEPNPDGIEPSRKNFPCLPHSRNFSVGSGKKQNTLLLVEYLYGLSGIVRGSCGLKKKSHSLFKSPTS